MAFPRFRFCGHFATRLAPDVARNNAMIHTTSNRQSIEVIAAAGLGFYTNCQWLALPSYVKIASVTAPIVSAAVLAQYKYSRTAFDHLLKRKKYLSKRWITPPAPRAVYLDGPAVQKTNELLHDLIQRNEKLFPALRHTSYRWQVLFAKDLSVWVDCLEDGSLLCSKDVLAALTKNEVLMLLSTQVAHVLARHKAEYTSFRGLVRHMAAISVWYYAFFVPVQFSYLVDAGILLVTYHILSSAIIQTKYRKLLLEADELGLAIASKMGATEKDAISLMEKMMSLRQQLPLSSRFRAMCHYKYRISALKNKDGAFRASFTLDPENK